MYLAEGERDKGGVGGGGYALSVWRVAQSTLEVKWLQCHVLFYKA